MTAPPPKTANGNAGVGNSKPDDEKKPDARTSAPESKPSEKQDLLKGTKPLSPVADDVDQQTAEQEETGDAEDKTEEKKKVDPPSVPETSRTDVKPRATRHPITRRLWPEKGDAGEKETKEGQTAEAEQKVEAKADATASAPEGAAHKPIDPAEAHVLVVEDNVPNFVLIARLLAYTGVERCEWKTSGWQVVEFADTLSRIDLILMDIRLPYEDGFQALEKVRAHPRFKDTLVVAVTAEASVEQMRRAKEAGFDGFLGKPLDPDKFPGQIRRVLNGQPVWEIH